MQSSLKKNYEFENFKELGYMSNVINETLRLYPPAGLLPNRDVVEDSVVGDYFIPKGNTIQVSVYSMHHDKEVWGDDVEDFNPDRFNNLTKLQKTAFLPFGGGPRICVGMMFSLIEQKIFLSKILSQYKISLTEGSRLEISNMLFSPRSEYLSYILEPIN